MMAYRLQASWFPIITGYVICQVFLKNITKQSFFDQTEFLMDLNEPSEEELKLIRSFQEGNPGRLRFFIRENVVPYGASWNRCIQNSSTEYVGVWNVDDLRADDSIRIQYEYLRTHDDVDVVTGPFEIIKSIDDKSGVLVNNSDRFEDYHTKGFYMGPFWMFKKSICDRAGYFDEQLRSSADYDLAIRLAMHGRIAFIDTCLGRFLG